MQNSAKVNEVFDQSTLLRQYREEITRLKREVGISTIFTAHTRAQHTCRHVPHMCNMQNIHTVWVFGNVFLDLCYALYLPPAPRSPSVAIQRHKRPLDYKRLHKTKKKIRKNDNPKNPHCHVCPQLHQANEENAALLKGTPTLGVDGRVLSNTHSNNTV
jgi:hypothetical protein